MFTISMLKAWSIFISQLTMIKENPFCERKCRSSGKLIRFLIFVAWPPITLSFNIFKSHIQYHCTTRDCSHWAKANVKTNICLWGFMCPSDKCQGPSVKRHRYRLVWISPIFQDFICWCFFSPLDVGIRCISFINTRTNLTNYLLNYNCSCKRLIVGQTLEFLENFLCIHCIRQQT